MQWQNQKRERIRKEFERSEENPFNQVRAAYDATKEEVRELREKEREKGGSSVLVRGRNHPWARKADQRED